MDFDPDACALRFSSPDELAAFHGELTALLREVTIALSGSTPDPEEARLRAREVLRQFELTAQILTAIRKHERSRR